MTGSIWISIHLVSTSTTQEPTDTDNRHVYIHTSQFTAVSVRPFVQGCDCRWDKLRHNILSAQEAAGAGGKNEKMKWLSLPVGRLDWCHPGGRLALNARRVGSRSPPPCCSHGSTVFVSVYHWAGQADLRAFTLCLSCFQPGLSYLTHPQHCLFFESTPSSCQYRALISHPPPPSLVFPWDGVNCFSHSFLSLFLSFTPPSLELLTFCSHFFFVNHSLSS